MRVPRFCVVSWHGAVKKPSDEKRARAVKITLSSSKTVVRPSGRDKPQNIRIDQVEMIYKFQFSLENIKAIDQVVADVIES